MAERQPPLQSSSPQLAGGDLATSSLSLQHDATYRETSQPPSPSTLLRVLPKSCSSPVFTSLNESRSSPNDDSVTELVPDSFTFEDKLLFNNSFAALDEFYRDRLFCDVQICVGKRELHCHRIVLACFSRYFRSMFQSEMSECRNKMISIKDVDESAFVDLVGYAYTSRITMTTENVQTLLYACSILQVDSVAAACCDFMSSHLDPCNCIGTRNFAEQHGQRALIERADRFMLDNFVDIVAGEDFSSMTHQNLELLISSPDLNVRNEMQVYEAVMKWIRLNESNNQQHLPSLIGRMRLALMPAPFLIQIEDTLKADLQCRDYLDEAKLYQMSLNQMIPEVKTLTSRMKARKSYAGNLLKSYLVTKYFTIDFDKFFPHFGKIETI